MDIIVYILFFLIFCSLFIYIYRKANNEDYLIKKANKLTIFNIKKREKILKKLTRTLSVDEFCLKILRDTLFYKSLSQYDIAESCNVDEVLFPLEVEKTKNDVNFETEEDFKKALCSQNVLLKQAACENIPSMSHLTNFFKERFEKEEDIETACIILEKSDIVPDIKLLISKLKKIFNDNCAAKLLSALYVQRAKLREYEKLFQAVENPKYRVILEAMINPLNFIENLIIFLEEESNPEFFNVILTMVSDIEINDVDKLERIIKAVDNQPLTQNIDEETGESLSRKIGDLSINEIWKGLKYLDYMSENTKMCLIGHILKFKNEKLLGALLSSISASKSREYYTFLSDILYNTENNYIISRALIALNSFRGEIIPKIASKLSVIDDEEVKYNLKKSLNNSLRTREQ
jgi:hypothetical protein